MIVYSSKNKRTTIQTNHFTYSYTKFALISLLFLIFITNILCELSLTYFKATNLLNGDIFIIHQNAIEEYDSSLTIKKIGYSLESSMQLS